MSLLDSYARVDHDLPCPVCQRISWCLISHDGTKAICQRVRSNVELGTAGWLHHLAETVPMTRKRAAKPKLTAFQCEVLQLDFTFLVGEQHDPYHLGVGVDGQATTYPMRDSEGNICGWRLRYPDGRKRSVAGGREGLFYRHPIPEADTVYVCEGPTDTCAALSLGFAAIGRPNCQPRAELVEAVLDRTGCETVVVVSDADEPGRRGANALGAYLVQRFPMVHCIVPMQHKDLAEYVQHGGTAEFILRLVETSQENPYWMFL